MLLSDVSIKRPVFSSVISLLLIAFGLLAFDRLPLREYPDIDPPIVSVRTNYPGADASVVETRITEVIEDRIAGVEGIKYIQSSSQDGRSNITIEFDIGRDMESATNDVRDRVSGVLNNLPDEADPPEVQKVDSSDDVIIWFNLTSDRMNTQELTDFAERYLIDRFSVLNGVARIRVGGGMTYAMRVWLDRAQLAAYDLTVTDVESALRSENVELPAGDVESLNTQFIVRVQRNFRTAEDFEQLVLGRNEDGYLIRLADVARVEKGTEEDRILFRSNGESVVGIGISKQSTANTIDVARAAKVAVDRINPTLPEGMSLTQSYDSSIFIEASIKEVYKTLGLAIALVILVIYLFLGSVRAMIVPAVTVPVSLIGTFILLMMWGFTLNLLTLLALVLAIGLVVDDAIVVLENIHRRMDEYGETPLVAAFRGTRQVGFAVIATTLVLVAVFAPIAVVKGDIGRLFSEFALTMSAAVVFSSLVALTASATLASKLLKRQTKPSYLVRLVDRFFQRFRHGYSAVIRRCLAHPVWVLCGFAALLGACVLLLNIVPKEFAPREDRGAFFISITGPEGASFSFMEEYVDEVERRLNPLLESGEASKVIMRAPGWGSGFNSGMAIVVLSDFSERRSAFDIMDEVRQNLSDLPGVRAFPLMRQGLSGGVGKPVQFVLGGGTYEELAEWRDILLEKIEEDNPGFQGLDSDYKETKPQLQVEVDYDRAAALGVSVQHIGRTLETMLGSRRVTTYIDDGEEYYVMVEGERDMQRSPTDMNNIYVRSQTSNELIPLANLVSLSEFAGPQSLNRYNRTRAITIEANLADDFTLGEALAYLEEMVREHLPDQVIIDYKGQSQDLKHAGGSAVLIFGLGILVMFLVLAAQFESYIHPFVIILTVPLAIAGGLFGIWVTGNSLNLYTQIGLIMLIGLAAKNGILIVEFANQLRNEGKAVYDAIVEATALRLRPIIMTSFTTAAGAIPLIVSFGAGAETRAALGVTLFSGVITATVFTLFVVPVVYNLLARFTGSPNAVAQQLQRELDQDEYQ
jgi:multidrug efflux pump